MKEAGSELVDEEEEEGREMEMAAPVVVVACLSTLAVPFCSRAFNICNVSTVSADVVCDSAEVDVAGVAAVADVGVLVGAFLNS